MTLLERFELDVAKAPHAQARYDEYRLRADPGALGLATRSLRDEELEARLARLLGHYDAVRVIPEPYSQSFLEADLNAVFQDPAVRPRDVAEKQAAAKLAVSWLARMATGEIAGFDVKPAGKELIDALRVDDLAEVALDGVAQLPSAEAQQALVSLAGQGGRPVDLRIRAGDAAILHIQLHGKLTPATLVGPIVAQSATETNAELRGKLIVLKGLLAPNPKDYVSDLRNYSPPLVPPPPPAPMQPMPKPPAPAP
jgi:hypothetical protein